MSSLKKLLAANKVTGQLDELLSGLQAALKKVQEEINSELKTRDDKFEELSTRVEKIEKTLESLEKSIRSLCDSHT